MRISSLILSVGICSIAAHNAWAQEQRVLTPEQQLQADLGLEVTFEDRADQPEIIRVEGDESLMPVLEQGVYWRLSDRLAVESPLPEGYPRPTPPECIEIKVYPSVRRAEISGSRYSGSSSSRGFMPLFRHIQRNDIAMTAPVEMDLEGWSARDGEMPDRWTMSFLYRTSDLRETGKEGPVVIRDTEEITVLAIGTRGDYGMRTFTPALERLENWLDEQDDWEIAGDPRWFGYNGPSVWAVNRWGEVQIPITRVEIETQDDDAS